MQESIHRYFKVGIVAAMAFPDLYAKDPCRAVSIIAADDYFDAIELNPLADRETWPHISSLINTSHLFASYSAHSRLLSCGLNPNHTEETERVKAENALKEGIDEAESLGISVVSFLSGHWSPESPESQLESLIRTTNNICAYAKSKGIFIELEVFDYDIAKKSLIGPAALAARYAKQVRTTHSNFGLIVDLSHIPMTHEDNSYVIQTLRPYITHLHIGNTVCTDPHLEAFGDEHPRFGFPNSSNDVEQLLDFLRILKAEGFMSKPSDMLLSFEVKPWQQEDSFIVLANSKRVLNRAWSLLED